MRRRKVALGIGIVGVVAFFFLVPAFYWFTAYSPVVSVNRAPIFVAYRSLGCQLLGFGDEYFTAGVTLSLNPMHSAAGLVFSCNPPILPL